MVPMVASFYNFSWNLREGVSRVACKAKQRRGDYRDPSYRRDFGMRDLSCFPTGQIHS